MLGERCLNTGIIGRMLASIYLRSVVTLLLLSALGKLLLVFWGNAELLRVPMPVLHLVSNRSLILLAAGLEVLVSIYVSLPGTKPTSALKSIAGLATVFCFYRLMLWTFDFKGHCECFGSLTSVLHLEEKQARFLSAGLLVYFLVGSYGCLSAQWYLSKKGKLETVS